MKTLKPLLLKYGYFFLRAYWFIRRPLTAGVKCVVCNEGDVLLVRHSYGSNQLTLIGGGVKRGEALEQAVAREGKEEVGLILENIRKIGQIYHDGEFKRDTVHVFMADSKNRGFTLSDGELTEATWYKIDKLPGDISPLCKRFLALVESELS